MYLRKLKKMFTLNQCSYSILPESNRKPKDLWCFQGDKMGTLNRNELRRQKKEPSQQFAKILLLLL